MEHVSTLCRIVWKAAHKSQWHEWCRRCGMGPKSMWQSVFHKEERWQQSSSFIHGWSKLLYKPRRGKLHSKNPRAISCWAKPDGEIRFTKAVGRMCLQRCGPLRVGMPQDDTWMYIRYAMYPIVCISSASKEFWSNVQKCWLAFAAEPFSVESVETCSNETYVLFQIMALVVMPKRPGSPIVSGAASLFSSCRMHHVPTTWYPEPGYWKHGSKQHVEGTASVGVAQGRSLAHQPRTFAIEQWQALLEAWQNSHRHNFLLLSTIFRFCFIMLHHVLSFHFFFWGGICIYIYICTICIYMFHKCSSFFGGFHRMLPAMLWETCSQVITTGDSRLWIRSFPGQHPKSQIPQISSDVCRLVSDWLCLIMID